MKPALSAISLALLCAAPVDAATLGTNLIVNGDAETGSTSGWDNTDSINVTTSADEVFAGTYAFAAGAIASSAGMTQTIDLSGLSGLIDTGGVTYTLAGQFQNRTLGGARDIVLFSVSFFGVGDPSFITGSPQLTDPSSPNEVYDYNADATMGAVPIGTLSAVVVLSFLRNAGGSTDAYADDLSFVLSAAPIPVPAGLPLLAGGLGALAWMRRRKG